MYCDWPQLGRCCFCVPLRRGILTFGYIHLFISIFMVLMYSFSMNNARFAEEVLFGRSIQTEICIALFCFEVIFDGLLIYGAHKKAVEYLKAYYYYAIITSVALLVIQIVQIVAISRFIKFYIIEMCISAFAALCLQVYLITLVWSLIKKLEIEGSHYENPLQQIVSGELKVERNGVYKNTTVVPTVV